MRRFLFFVVILLLCKPASGQQINYTANGVRLQTVFAALEKQTGYSFFYKSEDIRHLPRINVQLKNAGLSEALEQCIGALPLNYTIVDSTVVITIKRNSHPPAEVPVNMMLVTGKIVDEQDNPLAGASVQLPGTATGTVSNGQGVFTLQTPAGSKGLLQVSFVGFVTRQLALPKNGEPLLLTLEANSNSLDQVQVIGYGQTSRRFNTGNVKSITADDIGKQPVSNLLAAMEGRIPGISIQQRNGFPGAGYNVNIRGYNSIMNSNEPLIIVDGVPYPSSTQSLLNVALQGGSSLSYLDIASIDRIDVLKDADATTIYGSRAANGVILITTKKGKAGKTKLNINTYSGIGHTATTPRFLRTQDFLQLRHEAHSNDQSGVDATEYDINGVWDTTRYTDWQKILQGNLSHTTHAYASISGGSTVTQFYAGGGYQQENTTQAASGADKMGSFHFNISTSAFNSKLNVFVSTNYSLYTSSIMPYDFASDVLSLAPNAPALYKADGTLNFENNTFSNPLLNTRLMHKNTTGNFISNAKITWHISKNLDLLTTLGFNNLTSNQFRGMPASMFRPNFPNPVATSTFITTKKQTAIAEPQLQYKHKTRWGTINSFAGATFQENIAEGQRLTASGFGNDALLANISAASNVVANEYKYTQYRYNALFGRLNFNAHQEWLVNLNGRYDGSSRFGPDKQFHFFGSVGLGWIFSAEKRVHEKLPFLSFGKLRASYGSTGNDGIPDYDYLDTYNPGRNFMGIRGLYPSGLFNPDLAWELTKKSELGLELGFLHDKVLLNISYYRNRSSNMLLPDPVSSVTGFSVLYRNVPAVISNTGMEIELNTTNYSNAHFTWTSSFNISIPKNVLVAYPGLESSQFKDLFVPGQSLYASRRFNFAGVNPQNGLYQFYDSKGNITQTPDPSADLTALVTPGRRFYGGLQNKLLYKKFYLDFLLHFVNQYGATAFAAANGLIPGLGPAAMTSDILGRWQKPGDITNVQRMSYPATIPQALQVLQAISNFRNSSGAYGNSSFVRLQNISVGYDCSGRWLQKIPMESLRLYVQAQNLLTFTSYKTFDPETQNYSLPPLRTIVIGCTVTF